MRFPGWLLPLGSRGIAAVEFALVAPVLVVMIVGVSEETALLRAHMKLSHAAGLLGKMIAQQASPVTSGTSGTLGNLCTGAVLTLTPLASRSFSASIASVSTSATATALDWESDASCPTTAPALGSTAVSLATSTGLVPDAGDSVIIIKASYTYTPVTHFILSASYTLAQTIYTRPRANATIACSTC